MLKTGIDGKFIVSVLTFPTRDAFTFIGSVSIMAGGAVVAREAAAFVMVEFTECSYKVQCEKNILSLTSQLQS